MSKIFFCEFRSQDEAERAVSSLKEKYGSNFYSFVIDGGCKFEGGAVNYAVDGLNYFSNNTVGVCEAKVGGDNVSSDFPSVGASARLSFSDQLKKSPINDLKSLGAFAVRETSF